MNFIKIKKAGFILLSISIMLNGCISDIQMEGYPEVSFSKEVQPVIAANCTQSGCHGNVDTEEFPLVTYDEIRFKVEPGNGRKSELYRAMTGRGIEFMPPRPSSPLTEDQIRAIFIWIEQGAKNN
jgi:hypothetical protein